MAEQALCDTSGVTTVINLDVLFLLNLTKILTKEPDAIELENGLPFPVVVSVLS